MNEYEERSPIAGYDTEYPYPGVLEHEDAPRVGPMWMHVLTLEELGLLYILEKSGSISRFAALSIARNRGIDDIVANETVDFYFSRLAPKGSAPAQLASSVPVPPDLAPSPAAGDSLADLIGEDSDWWNTSTSCAASEGETSEGCDDSRDDAETDGKAKRTRRKPVALGEAGALVCLLEIKDGAPMPVLEGYIEEIQPAYPGLEIVPQLHQMARWLDANPQRRKTARGMKRFVASWLGRAFEQLQMRRAMTSSPRQNGFGTGGATLQSPKIPPASDKGRGDSADDGLGF